MLARRELEGRFECFVDGGEGPVRPELRLVDNFPADKAKVVEGGLSEKIIPGAHVVSVYSFGDGLLDFVPESIDTALNLLWGEYIVEDDDSKLVVELPDGFWIEVVDVE